MKTCPKCLIEKDESFFSKSARRHDGLQCQCKSCEKASHAKSYEAASVIGMPAEKLCGKCGLTKSSDEFHRHSKRPDGLQVFCRTCKTQTQREGYANPDGKLLKYHRDYQRKNPEYHTDYYLANKDEILENTHAGRELEPWRYIVNGARARAKKNGLEFNIDIEWGYRTYTGRCSLTGISFVRNHGAGSSFLPESASIDRIDQNKGYTKDNCRWICAGINCLRGIGDDETMYKIALALTLARIQTKTAP